MAVQALFDVDVAGDAVPADPRVAQLIAQAARFASLGFTPSYGPGDHGNLSCRAKPGLIMTARETVKARLRPEDVVEVVGVDETRSPAVARCYGRRLPSTDALLHWRLYRARPEIGAILHGHDAVALARAGALKLPITTQSASTQTLRLIKEVVELAKTNDYLLLRDHGFLALGKSIEEAGQLVEAWAQRARALPV